MTLKYSLLLDNRITCQSCYTPLVTITALIPLPKSGSESGSNQICRHLVDFFWILTGMYFRSYPIVQKCVACFMTLFSWVWIQFFPKNLLKSTVETKCGLLLKSNSLSPNDKRPLPWEIQLNTTNCEIK